MPLFNMPKKSVLNEFLSKDDNLIKEEIKPQIIEEFNGIKEDYAILGCNKLSFYYKVFLKDKKPFINKTFTYLPDIDIFENKILMDMYALKILIEYLKKQGTESIIIYSNINNLDVIKDYSQLKDMGSMFRYKAREILELLNTYSLRINFKDINNEENYKYKELIENENTIQ